MDDQRKIDFFNSLKKRERERDIFKLEIWALNNGHNFVPKIRSSSNPLHHRRRTTKVYQQQQQWLLVIRSPAAETTPDHTGPARGERRERGRERLHENRRPENRIDGEGNEGGGGMWEEHQGNDRRRWS